MSEKISRMGLRDIGECAEIYTRIFTAAPWNEPWTDKLAFRRLKHFYDRRGAIGFVYRYEKKIIGFLLGNWVPWLDGNAFVLKEICVETDEKYSGIGTEMLDRLYAFLRVKNVGVVELVAMKGSDAYDFFKSKGFVEHERLVFMSKSHLDANNPWAEADSGNYHCHCDENGKNDCCDNNDEDMEDGVDAHIEHKE